jgi:hypothetical protein
MTNHHLSPAARAMVHQLLRDGGKSYTQIAAACGCSRSAVIYQRGLLIEAGQLRPDLLPPQRVYVCPPERSSAPRRNHNAAQYGAPICIVGGCDKRRKGGQHCEDHQPSVQIARATAGMSEATRRKLTGGRA